LVIHAARDVGLALIGPVVKQHLAGDRRDPYASLRHDGASDLRVDLDLAVPSWQRTSTGRFNATPAMAAGVADHKWTLREIAALLD
jgi:hypothetical protein